MCGIWGIIAKTSSGLYVKDAAIAQQMMMVTALRGMHSTGLAISNYKKPKGKPRIWRTIGGPCFLIQNKCWEDIDKYMYQEGGAVFGHGRYATKGAVTAKNAHPFHHKHITLVHNGTINSGLTYDKQEEEAVEVDSHALCIKIADVGIKSALEDVSGAYAIILHDAHEGAIYFGKNIDRPLYYVETSDRILLMSTRESLEFVAKQNSIYSQIYMAETDKIYRFDLETYALTEAYKISKPVKQYSFPGYGGGYEDAGYWQREPWNNRSYYNDNHRSYHKDKQKVEFIVEAVSKINDREYLYEGTTTSGLDMEFKTNEHITDLIGQVGSAEVCYEIIRQGKNCYFVKYRDIEWAEQVVFETWNNKKLKKEHWKIITKTEKCGVCGDPIGEDDVAKTIVEENGAVICKSCVEIYAKNLEAQE